MGRRRQFDEDEVLDTVLELFWRQGFVGCSVGDIVGATGLSKASLYHAFGSKEQLFVAALGHYERRVQEGLAPLQTEHTTVADLRAYITAALMTFESRGGGGCLVVVTSMSAVARVPEVRVALDAAASAVRGAFLAAVQRCQARGEHAHLDARATADRLYALLHGLAALRASGGPELAASILDDAFHDLFPGDSP